MYETGTSHVPASGPNSLLVSRRLVAFEKRLPPKPLRIGDLRWRWYCVLSSLLPSQPFTHDHTPMKLLLPAITALVLSLQVGRADWRDLLNVGGSKSTNKVSGSTAGLDSLSQDQMTQGLKEALGKGVQHAVSQLGHEGGFLTNASVKIPMPEQLRTVETTLRTLKQDQMADDFVATMNHAAEQAVPEAAGVFGDAVKGMSIADVKAILTGPNDAATQYFRRVTQTNLHAKFLPIVKTATDKTGVTSSYKRIMATASGSNYLGSFGSGLLNSESLDIDVYVTDKALDELFKMIAAEEKLIRENPMAQTSGLLQKVFGAVGK